MMELKVEADGAVIQPKGENIVAASVHGLRATMRQALDFGVHDLTLDLADVHMIDSVGIGLLIATQNSLGQLGGRLRVIHASEDIAELFRTLNLARRLGISGNEVDDGRTRN